VTEFEELAAEVEWKSNDNNKTTNKNTTTLIERMSVTLPPTARM
jgi:hypothetical protein